MNVHTKDCLISVKNGQDPLKLTNIKLKYLKENVIRAHICHIKL